MDLSLILIIFLINWLEFFVFIDHYAAHNSHGILSINMFRPTSIAQIQEKLLHRNHVIPC